MFLSVVIPTLNEEKYISLILRSFVDQTNKNFEVIVADTHSEDKTVEKAEEFAGKFNLKIIQVARKNVAHQRNAGGKEAKGDAIVFLDADYTVNKEFVETTIREVEKRKADLIIPFSYPITKNLLWTVYFYIQNYICKFSTIVGKPFGVASAAIITKEGFHKMKGYNESVFVFEDQYFFQVAKNHDLKIKNTNNVNVNFSLRRIEKDGVLGYFYFNLYATFYYILRGPVYKKFYDYQMGGGKKK